MAIYSYRSARGQTRWMLTITCRRRTAPADEPQGSRSQEAAIVAETEARKAGLGVGKPHWSLPNNHSGRLRRTVVVRQAPNGSGVAVSG